MAFGVCCFLAVVCLFACLFVCCVCGEILLMVPGAWTVHHVSPGQSDNPCTHEDHELHPNLWSSDECLSSRQTNQDHPWRLQKGAAAFLTVSEVGDRMAGTHEAIFKFTPSNIDPIALPAERVREFRGPAALQSRHLHQQCQ